MERIKSWQNVGQHIRSLRKEYCLTIKQLALGCDLSTNAISLIERGRVAPTVETLCKIAHALGVSAASLFQEVCPSHTSVYRSTDQLSPTRTYDGLAVLPCLADDPPLSSTDTPGRHWTPPIIQTIVCVCGNLAYEADHHIYELNPGDSLALSGDAPGYLHNLGNQTGVALLIMPSIAAQRQND